MYNFNKIVLLQKRAIKIISGANRLAHLNKQFDNFIFLKLNDIIQLKTLILGHLELLIMIFPKNIEEKP